MGCPWVPVCVSYASLYHSCTINEPEIISGSQLDAPTGIYFNRTDVKQAIHAPLDVDWAECTGGIFPDGDTSLPPALTVLPSVIEKNNRTVIVHGLADYVFLYEGQALFLVTFEPMLTAFFLFFVELELLFRSLFHIGSPFDGHIY